MAAAREREIVGPDIWAIVAGWLSLVLGVMGLNWWALAGNWGAEYKLFSFIPLSPLKIGIVTLALFLTWVFGYWPRISAATVDWARRGGLNATLVTVGILAVAVGINYMFHRYHWQRDLTENKRFTLSDRSLQVLKTLKEPVRVTAFFNAGDRSRNQAENLLGQYKDASDRFKYTIIEPLAHPDLIEAKKVQALPAVVFEYKGRQEQTSQVGEKEFTTALLKLTKEKRPKVLFLEGHGEMSYTAGTGSADDPQRSLSQVVQNLTSSQWETSTLSLAGKNAKAPEPAEAGVVVIAGPQRPITSDEEKLLVQYLDKGGRILALLSPGNPDLSGLLKPYGLAAENSYVYDPDIRNGWVLIQTPENHPINRKISRILMVDTRPVTPASPAPTGVTAQSLLKSGPNSITSATRLQQLDPNAPGLKKGAVSVAAVSTKPGGTNTPESRVVVIGSALAFSDALMATYGQTTFNGDLFANAVNWLGDQSELVSIEPKETNPKSLPVQPEQRGLLMLIYWLEFPLLAVALGIFIYLKRR